MKRLLFILHIFICLGNFVFSQQDIIILKGTVPLIDGIISNGEWNDAEYKIINVNPLWDVQVFYKHSDSNLYFAFSNLVVNGFGQRYPDILLDINNDKNIAWQNDDWWFHASYNDCEAQGSYNNWSSCIPDHPGWSANNFPLNEPGIVEIEISYSKIGLQSQFNDTIGISFIVSDTYNDYHYYPAAASIDKPSTWVNGIISQFPSFINKENNFYSDFKIYPNPVKNYLEIKFNELKINYFRYIIYSFEGKIIESKENFTNDGCKINCEKWENGVYFLKIQTDKGESILKKFIKY